MSSLSLVGKLPTMEKASFTNSKSVGNKGDCRMDTLMASAMAMTRKNSEAMETAPKAFANIPYKRTKIRNTGKIFHNKTVGCSTSLAPTST